MGQGGSGRPPYAGGGRPAGGRPGGPGGLGGRPGQGRDGSSSFGRSTAGGRPAPGGRPVAGAKDGKAEPNKDERKKEWSKNAQAQSTRGNTRYEKPKQLADGNTKVLNKKGSRPAPKKIIPIQEPEIGLIQIPLTLTVKELAEKMHRSGAECIKILMKKGVMATVNQEIDFATATEIAETFNIMVEEAVEVDLFDEAFNKAEADAPELLETRPPVVVVMGHVDHGKTSLLDAIRKTNVQSGEAGGITQHIGAYTVNINGKPITFLDTPGHEAFTAMRMRGAQVTDIAIVVVAADDGVMPQTIEALNHAKAAGVDVIIAITMIDRPAANPDKVKQQLTEYGIVVEEYGGETICVPVSARQGTNIEQLLEMIILLAEMKDYKANPHKHARGTIIEAELDKGRGPVATVLVQDGTLEVGDPVVAGACFGKIRAMVDDKGKKLKSAGPSIPVEILGLSEVPAAGDMFYVAANEKQARSLADSVVAKGRVNMIKSTPGKVSLNDLFSQIQAGNVKDLDIVIKADVQGSVEALRTSLEKISNEEVRVRIIHGAVGAITESDVMLASASSAIIIGFNVRPEPTAKSMADAEKVDIRLYRVIYNAIEDVTAAMKGMLEPVFQEKVLGHAEIRQLFKVSGVGTIGGSYVTDGLIRRNCQVRILRDSRIIYDGTLDTLRRFKDDVREVNSGYECGLLFNRYNDIHEGDKVEAYVMEEIPR